MNIAHLLIDTITYQTPTGLSAAGAPTWSAQTTADARVEYGYKHVVNLTGQTKESEAVIATLVEIPNNARVWFPGASTADVNQSRRPILSKRAYTLDGSFAFYETYF